MARLGTGLKDSNWIYWFNTLVNVKTKLTNQKDSAEALEGSRLLTHQALNFYK